MQMAERAAQVKGLTDLDLNYPDHMNEDPAELAKKKQELQDFQPPLDIVDGAARVMDPLFDGINTGKHWCGKFLKDYNPIAW